jgi:hypothetical protein
MCRILIVILTHHSQKIMDQIQSGWSMTLPRLEEGTLRIRRKDHDLRLFTPLLSYSESCPAVYVM